MPSCTDFQVSAVQYNNPETDAEFNGQTASLDVRFDSVLRGMSWSTVDTGPQQNVGLWPEVRKQQQLYSGPDQILPAVDGWTCDPHVAVKLRLSGRETVENSPVSIVTSLRDTARKLPDNTALAVQESGSWKTWTYSQYFDDVCLAARALIKLGVEPHHAVGILGYNSPEWMITNMAAIFTGAISTGIYTTNSAEACRHVINDARCDVIVVDNDRQLEKILKVRSELRYLKAIVQYRGQPTEGVYSWTEFLALGREVPEKALTERIKRLGVNQCCTLIYTSGTTGNPKGAMLNHDNLMWTAKTGSRPMGFQFGSERLVSYLPLSHVAAQLSDIYIALVIGAAVYFAPPDAIKGKLVDTLREVRPTLLVGVPRVYEKIQEKLEEVSSSQGLVRRVVFNWARSIGLQANMARTKRGSVPFGYTLAHQLVFRHIHEALGLDKCRVLMSAAAPLMKDTDDFFSSIDLPLLQAYGMSESSGPHSVNTPSHCRPMSSGQLLSGCTVRILQPDSQGSGEICMQGRNVFMGYINSPTLTTEALDVEGWLHSGDTGLQDGDGYLYITGRIKELLITAGGENVAPVPIEDTVKALLPIISHCMLVGDRRKFLSILLTLKTEVDHDTSVPRDVLSSAAVEWCRHHCPEVKVTTVGDVIASTQLTQVIQEGINQANKQAISHAQTIQKWTILSRDFSVVGGELGPTMKVKRPVVLKMYNATINAFYV